METSLGELKKKTKFRHSPATDGEPRRLEFLSALETSLSVKIRVWERYAPLLVNLVQVMTSTHKLIPFTKVLRRGILSGGDLAWTRSGP